MSRLFTFGCSFTRYDWPTWADILAQDPQYTEYQNWGKLGGGNHFILYSLTEAINRNNINKDDTIAIMWTSVGREDRYIKGEWFTPGSIYNSPLGANEEYIKNYTDPDGFLLTSLSIINAASHLIKSIGCKVYQFKMVPFLKIDDSFISKVFSLNLDHELYKLYGKSLHNIKDSFVEVAEQGNWYAKDFVPIFKQKIELENIKNSYKTCAGSSWPSLDEFLNNDYSNTSTEIYNEIEDVFHLRSMLSIIKSSRIDDHPSPIEHWHYLNDIGISLTNIQKDYALEWEHKVRTDKNFKFMSNKVKRF